MKRFRVLAQIALLVVVLAAAANGQRLENRHLLELRLGAWNHNHQQGFVTSFGDRGAHLDANGFTGGLSYGYFVSEALAVTLSVGMRSASADVALDRTQVRLEAASVVHILCGVKYYLPRSTYGSSVRPFLMADFGPVVGSQTWAQGWYSTEMRTGSETAMGVSFGAGANFLLGSQFTSGITFGYYLMSDFDVPIGGYHNYNGPVLAISLGYLFGGGRDHQKSHINEFHS